MTIEEFIEKCQKRPIPHNPLARVRLLARELAEGTLQRLWSADNLQGRDIGKFEVIGIDLEHYIKIRWNWNYPSLLLLVNNEYLSMRSFGIHGGVYFGILSKAFDLLEEIEEAIVFISYKRSESSAFALLTKNTLKQHGIEPFVDMQLQAGDDWRSELEVNIKNSDYFIILLGNKTLDSDVTIQEIKWALEGNVTLIPIWHNGFEFEAKDWLDLPDAVTQALSSTHTLRVLEENPLTYDTALRELLNRFGIST